VSKAAVTGVYTVAESRLGPARLIMDVLGGVPVIYFRPEKGGGLPLHLLDGPAWDGTGVFYSVTPEGNAGEPDDQKLYHIRGTVVSAREIEFYLVSPAYGMEGPLTALRTAAKN
jgi:hypothetical protein